jgi:hypothetical protein
VPSSAVTTSPATSRLLPASATAPDWDAVIAALDGGRLPASGGEQRIVRIAASLAAGHPVSLRDAIPGLDQRNLELVTVAIRHAAGQRP